MHRTFRCHICKALGENTPPVLQDASFVIDKGRYGRAAELFGNIAHVAYGRGGLLLLDIP